MKYLVLCCSLNCLFFISTVYATVTIQPNYSIKSEKAFNYTYRKAFDLSCNVTTDSKASVTVEWSKDGKAVKDIAELKDRVKFSTKDDKYILTIDRPDYNDAGNYTCEATAGDESANDWIFVVSSVAVNIKPDDMVVIDEEKLKIICQVLGNPLPDLVWELETSRFNGTQLIKENTTDNHVILLNNTDDKGQVYANGILVIEKVDENDRGYYTCVAKSKYTSENTTFPAYVRIKDKYAALWPFLGICVEVIVLCTIIIIYEKKRNKSELEESDTDQSPDQKNTPDHGKEANLRHRQ